MGKSAGGRRDLMAGGDIEAHLDTLTAPEEQRTAVQAVQAVQTEGVRN